FGAMPLSCCGAGPVIAEAAQWRLSKCSDSPGALSCSWIQPGAAAGGGGPPGAGRPGRAGAAQAAHACQGQLPVPGSGEISRGEPPAAPGCDAGLQPAQPAVAFLDRDAPPAPGALAAVIVAGEVIAGPAVGLCAVAGSPGQAVRAAADRGGGPD